MRVIDYFDKSAALHPDRDFVVSDEGAVTYSAAQEASVRLATALQVDGLESGDPVGVLAPNTSAALLGMLGLWRAGAAWVPLNPYNAINPTVDIMNEVACRYLLVHSDFAHHLEAIRSGVPSLVRVIAIDASIPGCDDLDTFLAKGDEASLVEWGDPWGNGERVCAYLATGGTTAASKVVVHTNRVWSSMIETCTRYWPSSEHPVNLMVAPITHAAGIMGVILSSVGATIVVREGFDVADTLESIEGHGVTHLFVPPTAFYEMLSEQRERPRDCSSLQMLLISGAPTAPAKFSQGVEVFGPCIATSWGQSEAPYLLSHLSPETLARAVAGERPELLRSCGQVAFSSQVAVMAPDGRILGANESGELVVRGPLVADGYFRRPDETAESQRHGWLHTGDIGMIDDTGHVFILDRLKDMIITGGFNVYPAEVEGVILRLPAVRECAVIGVPDDHWGERVTAIVVREPGQNVEATAIVAATKDALGSVKAPKQVVFVPSLPRTSVGKIDKKAVRVHHSA